MAKKEVDLNSTIFALASGKPPTAVAILKIVGPQAFEVVSKLAAIRKARAMQYASLVFRGKKLDNALVLTFPGPNSHTGDDTVEIHCHGSVAVVKAIEDALLELRVVPAKAGEFSYRALLNGKLTPSDLDLLGDLFLAQKPSDLARLYSRKEESMEGFVQSLRQSVIRLQAVLDTAVDFSDEYSHVVASAMPIIHETIRESSQIIQRYSAFKAGSQVPRLVLAGRPNAGKSSLFNALLCRYRAIVHEEPGTTRDVVEEDIKLGPYPWKLVDTAGYRETTAETESQGISMGSQYLEAASAWVLVVDGTLGLGREESVLLEKFGTVPYLVVWNKMDVPGWKKPRALKPTSWLAVSARTGQGIIELSEALVKKIKPINQSQDTFLPSYVHTARLCGVVESLRELKTHLELGVPPEYAGEKVRQIGFQLESLFGEITSEDVLDRVFKDFCIGK